MDTVIARRALTSRFHLEATQGESGAVTMNVVKTSNGQAIPLDEPLFLLRARDLLVVPLLLCYRALIKAASYPSPEAKEEHLESNQEAILTFEHFAHHHPERMKLPNVTRGR